MSSSRAAFWILSLIIWTHFTIGRSVISIPYDSTQFPIYLLTQRRNSSYPLLQSFVFPVQEKITVLGDLDTLNKTRLSKLYRLSPTFRYFSLPIYSTMIGVSPSNKYFSLAIYFFLNYLFTVIYNVSSKKILTAMPLPCTFSAIVLLIGVPLFLPIWFFKPPRNIFEIDRKSYNIIALCHGLGHITTSYSLNSGSVSFTHVVKSAEPLFTALLSFLVTRKQLSTVTYLTLIPIVVGVALASLKEFSFSWVGFLNAMASNFFFQSRMVLSKVLLSSEKEEKKLSAPNTFRVVTILSLFQSIIFAIILEGSLIGAHLSQFMQNSVQRDYILKHLLIAGVSFYCYNEIAFWILDLVHPITNAVGNTIKRVVLVIASIFIFHVPVSTVGMMGATIAVVGSLLYALSSEQSKESRSAANGSTSPEDKKELIP